mgnify:CR=1 FL=1
MTKKLQSLFIKRKKLFRAFIKIPVRMLDGDFIYNRREALGLAIFLIAASTFSLS